MTVETTDNRINYVGDDSTEDFAFNFKTFDESSILVLEDNVLTGAAVVITLNGDQDTSPGGSANVVPAPVLDVIVTVQRKVNLTQGTDYITGGPFPSDAHEQALDKLTMQNQQQKDENSRSVMGGVDSDSGTDFTMPLPEANRGIKWNAGGDGLQNTVNDPDSVPGSGVDGITSAATGLAIAINATDVVEVQKSIFSTPILTAGSASTYTVTFGISSLVVGRVYEVRIHVDNSGPCGININAVGYNDIKLVDGANPSAGQLRLNMIAKFLWDGTNMLLLNPYNGDLLQVIKSADESVNSSTTLQDDDELFVTLAANGLYEFEALLIMTSNVPPDFKYQWIESDGTYDFAQTLWETGASVSQNSMNETTASMAIFVTGTTENLIMLKGIIIAGGAGGLFKLQWAQNTSDAGSTMVKTNSYMKLTRLG